MIVESKNTSVGIFQRVNLVITAAQNMLTNNPMHSVLGGIQKVILFPCGFYLYTCVILYIYSIIFAFNQPVCRNVNLEETKIIVTQRDLNSAKAPSVFIAESPNN